MAAMLRLEKVTSGYGPTVILEDISLDLGRGEVLAVLGRNGAGKTTLMKTIVGQTRLHAGQIELAGESIGPVPAHRRSGLGIGYCPQTRDIFPSLTVEENLLVAARPGPWTAARVFDLFPNLAERRRNGGTQISGGEQQMLTVGRALMGNPGILLLDEPMEGLAPLLVEQLLKAFALLRRDGDLAIVLVEQYVHLALNFAPRAIVLDRGRVVFDGASDALASDQGLMTALLGASGNAAAAT